MTEVEVGRLLGKRSTSEIGVLGRGRNRNRLCLRVPDPYTCREINPLIAKREKGSVDGVHGTQAAKRRLIGWGLGVLACFT